MGTIHYIQSCGDRDRLLYLGYDFISAIRFIFPLAYTFSVGGLIAAVAIGLIFGMLAAVIPARQAPRREIITALHYE